MSTLLSIGLGFIISAALIGLFVLGIWVAFTFAVPSAQAQVQKPGNVSLGNLTEVPNSTKFTVSFSADTGCSDCVAEFKTDIKYTDGQSKTVSDTVEPDSGIVTIDWSRYDLISNPKPETIFVSGKLVNTLNVSGLTQSKSYSTMRS
jgi:hypothetical protein